MRNGAVGALPALWQPSGLVGDKRPFVILVAYRNTDALRASLQLLGGRLDVLVIDNDAEGSVEALATDCGAAYVSNGANLGFAAAVNIGLERRAGRDVLLLNPDARVEPEVVAALEAALCSDPSLCAVAPRLVGDDGLPQRVLWPIPSPREEWVKAFRLQRFFPARQTFLVGAVLLLRHEALDDVGPFDERFFLYAEECDWQLRALSRGWRTHVVAGVVAQHAGSGSSAVERRREELFHRSAALFAVKWYGEAGWRSMQLAARVGAATRFVLTLPSRKRRSRYLRELRR
jgi:GT2 family glycosyltransferase